MLLESKHVCHRGSLASERCESEQQGFLGNVIAGQLQES